MKQKSIIAVILNTTLILSIALAGCSDIPKNRTDFAKFDATDGTDNIITHLEDGTSNNSVNIQNSNSGTNNNAKNIADSARKGVQSAVDAIRYGARNLKNDITNAGYKLSESPNTKSDYFKGNETDYQLGEDRVRIYEYSTPGDLDMDINRISSDGLSIKETSANYNQNSRPYFYKKGNSLIVYEGREPAYLDEFKRLFGNTLRP